METADDSNQPIWKKYLRPLYIETEFQKATSRLTWIEVEKATYWWSCLPCPAIVYDDLELYHSSIRDYLSGPKRYSREEIEIHSAKRKQLWEDKAKLWFLESKSNIRSWKDRFVHHVEKGLQEREAESGLKTALTAQQVLETWCNQHQRMTVPEFIKFPIVETAKSFLDEVLERHKANYSSPENTSQTFTLPEPAQKPPSKKQAASTPYSFIDLLTNGFTKENLDGLLRHMLIKNEQGETLTFKKYLLHSVINALQKEEFLTKSNQERDQKSLSVYLGLAPTRIKATEGKKLQPAQIKAMAYLTRLKKERGKNRSF